MACLTMEFTEQHVPVSFRWNEPLTDEEFIAFSERNKPFQFERNRAGEIVVMTVGGVGSQREMLVSSALHVWNLQAGTGRVFSSNGGFKLPDGSLLSPDASWVAQKRWEGLTEKQRNGLLPLCPDFLIEVRSNTDSRRSAEKKMKAWMENGAKLAWLIDPIACSVMIYRAGEPTETLKRPDIVRGHAPVDGFVLETTSLWEP